MDVDRLLQQLRDRDEEIARLRAELAAVRRDLKRLLEELAGLREQDSAADARAQETIRELATQVAQANERISELLAVVQRKQRKRSAPKDKEPSPPPDVDEQTKIAFENRPRPPGPPGPPHDRPRQQQRRPGRHPLPSHLEVDESTVHPKRCECGCEDFDIVDEVVEEKLTVRAHQRVRRAKRKTGRCKRCGRRVTGEAPPSPFPRSKVTCEWLGWLVAQKFQLFVPLDRITRYLGAQGIALTKSFLVSQIERVSDLLAPIDGEHWKQLLAGPWMGSDGTGLDVLVQGVGLHHGFIEVYHREDLVVFQYTPEKGGQTQAEKLARFAGTLLVDAESRYNETFETNEKITKANCNAHPRRKLGDAEVAQPHLAEEAGRFITAAFDAEALAKERGLTGDDLLKWRQDRIAPLFEDFRHWSVAVLPTLTPGDPLAKVLRYYDKHWAGLTRCLTDPHIPLDNSGSERLFQAVAKLRLNCLFAGSSEGAHRAAMLLGIVATCKRLGIDVEAYITWALVRRGTHRDKYKLSAAELTPAAYLRAHPSPPRR